MTEFSHINIDLDKTCRIFERRESDYEDPVFVARGKKIFGWACAIKWENAIQGAKRAGKNLDDYLTAQIAARMGDFAGRKNARFGVVCQQQRVDLSFLYIALKRVLQKWP